MLMVFLKAIFVSGTCVAIWTIFLQSDRHYYFDCMQFISFNKLCTYARQLVKGDSPCQLSIFPAKGASFILIFFNQYGSVRQAMQFAARRN